MKKQSKNLISLTALLAVLCTSYATVSFGAPAHNIKYTKHNFGTTRLAAYPAFKASASGQWATEICIFCHTPHNAAAGKKFLWNRVDSTATFALYTASPTLNFAKTGAAIGSVSKMCMSCHDGGTAINAMAQPYNPAITMSGGVTGDEIGDIYDPIQLGTEWGPNIGEGTSPTDDISPGGNLVNDHPISFIYSQSQAPNDPTIKTADGAGAASIGGLPLWLETIGGSSGYRVECVTCHDPHINYNAGTPGGNAAYRPFLRKTMNSSSLCFTCHDK